MVRDRPERRATESMGSDVASASMGAYGRNRSLQRVRCTGAGPAWIAFRRLGPVVVALGAPRVEADAEWGRAWVVWYGSTEIPRSSHGTRSLGEEAVLRTDRFTLKGPRMRRLRSALQIAEREGIQVVETDWSHLDDDLRRQAWAIERSWRRRHPIHLRFSFSTFEDATADDRAWFVGLSCDRVVAFITWLPSSDGRGWVGDLMRRDSAGPHGAMDLLIVRGIEAARAQGFEWVSLGIAKGGSLRRFKEKFRPEWQPRSILLPRGRFARGAALAAVAAVHVAPSPPRSRRGSFEVHSGTTPRRHWIACASAGLIAVLLLLTFAASAQGADIVLRRLRETPVATRAVNAWDHRPSHFSVPTPPIHLPGGHE